MRSATVPSMTRGAMKKHSQDNTARVRRATPNNPTNGRAVAGSGFTSGHCLRRGNSTPSDRISYPGRSSRSAFHRQRHAHGAPQVHDASVARPFAAYDRSTSTARPTAVCFARLPHLFVRSQIGVLVKHGVGVPFRLIHPGAVRSGPPARYWLRPAHHTRPRAMTREKAGCAGPGQALRCVPEPALSVRPRV